MERKQNPADGGVYWVVSPEYAALMQGKIATASLPMDDPNAKPGPNYNCNGGIFTRPELKREETSRSISVHIKRATDGELRVVNETGDGWGWKWSEGNWGCDCNRRREFDGEAFDDSQDYDCTEGKYAVRIFDAETGEMLYDEWEASK